MRIPKKFGKALCVLRRKKVNPVNYFHSEHYLRHNARRLEHLASLRIPVAGKRVLELGAGIGDHSHYYLDRDCDLTITDARDENVELLRKRYPGVHVQQLDLERMANLNTVSFDVTHCYGLLYHLSNPSEALEFMSEATSGVLLLETCVSFGDSISINPVQEVKRDPTQAYHGEGCRPTRTWIYNKLKELFEHVYVPTTQPNHGEYPLGWDTPEVHTAALQRAIFIASRYPIMSEILRASLPVKQVRHE